MKKQLFALLSLGVMLAASSAFAQNTVKANIPFNFIVSGAKLPAGAYTIHKMGASERTLLIQNSEGQTLRIVQPNRCESLKAADRSKLVFHKYGDKYFLAEIWVVGSNTGQQLPTSKREAETAMDYTSAKTVVVAALQ